MKIGFTGTRDGMTQPQMQAFDRFICELPAITEFHHGDCVGADDEAANSLHEVLHEEGERWRVVKHPPSDLRACACNPHFDEARDAMPYLERNRNIVDACDLLIACPKGPEEMRSGTWSTVRYARKQGKRVVIIWPTGELSEGK